ncbi:MAG: hypothetical protein A2339_08015 [Elusimicrobia bacterium RIFOXYB12_FULL_50_12]|nr:MAG: hypothetical protein A2278_02710 [Elusimicrobia bacterium RIFOXYA12_FULL_49_49]OGS16392.1 MAG: hypothetical protein A2251_06165 [Elusimicrobia bacterium RIFOXYA2_FULL_47_53]OGS27231.1 MAG: hypothetical protein A2339_08015 [Elusimicrobia bacterium RIFOXYB12_FULL_50_12]OGS30431.1 MAG: hypothetical protein A2323_02875 [Elusimicrobia bacterium RIFOXYB2_FULL_46_23]
MFKPLTKYLLKSVEKTLSGRLCLSAKAFVEGEECNDEAISRFMTESQDCFTLRVRNDRALLRVFHLTLLSLLLLFACGGVFAQDIAVTASVNSNVIAINEQLELNIIISGNASDLPNLELPQIANFTAYSAGRSQNTSIINGQVSSSVAFRYALVPQNTGKFTIPALSFQYKNNTYATQPVNVEVVAASSSGPQAANAAPGAARRNGKDIFITASVDKTSAYVNEQITYTFKFFRRIRLLSNPQYSPPDFSGFWTEDTPPKNYFAAYEGSQYQISEIKIFLFATKPGKFTISPATLQCSVEDFSPADISADSFFMNFFSGGKAQTLRTNPVTVSIKPLPENGRPDDFTGSVGRYELSAELDRKTAAVNDPVTLSLKVSGSGNIKTISEPKLPSWPDFRKYETVSSLNIAKDKGEVSGSKTFKTVIVPMTPGDKNLSGLSFSFFDPAKNKYIKLRLPALSLSVKPGAPGQAPQNSQPAESTVKLVNRDIRYLKTPAKWHEYSGPLYKNPWFIILNILPLLGLAAAFFTASYRDKLSGDTALARHLGASAAARKYLKQAASLLSEDKSGEFYCAISRALLEYIADKTNLSAEGLTGAAITDILSKRNISAETINIIITVLGECDLVRFSPSRVSLETMSKTYESAGRLIDMLEKGLKKK